MRDDTSGWHSAVIVVTERRTDEWEMTRVDDTAQPSQQLLYHRRHENNHTRKLIWPIRIFLDHWLFRWRVYIERQTDTNCKMIWYSSLIYKQMLYCHYPSQHPDGNSSRPTCFKELNIIYKNATPSGIPLTHGIPPSSCELPSSQAMCESLTTHAACQCLTKN